VIFWSDNELLKFSFVYFPLYSILSFWSFVWSARFSDTSGIAFGVCFFYSDWCTAFWLLLIQSKDSLLKLCHFIYDSTLPDERECGVFFTSCFNSVWTFFCEFCFGFNSSECFETRLGLELEGSTSTTERVIDLLNKNQDQLKLQCKLSFLIRQALWFLTLSIMHD
jgi:hypothetical protein